MSDPFDEQEEGSDEFEVAFEEDDSQPEDDTNWIAQVVGIENSVGKDSGVPMLVFTLRILGTPEGEESPCSGFEEKIFCSKSRAAQWKMEETINAILPGRAELGKKLKFTKDDVMGVHVQAHVEHQEYNNRKSPKFAFIGPHPKKPGKKTKIKETDEIPF